MSKADHHIITADSQFMSGGQPDNILCAAVLDYFTLGIASPLLYKSAEASHGIVIIFLVVHICRDLSRCPMQEGIGNGECPYVSCYCGFGFRCCSPKL